MGPEGTGDCGGVRRVWNQEWDQKGWKLGGQEWAGTRGGTRRDRKLGWDKSGVGPEGSENCSGARRDRKQGWDLMALETGMGPEGTGNGDGTRRDANRPDRARNRRSGLKGVETMMELGKVAEGRVINIF